MSGNLDESIIAYVVKFGTLMEIQRAGVTEEDFVDEYRTVWRYILRMNRDHNTIPSKDVLVTRFPDIRVPSVSKSDFPILVSNLKQRKKYIDFLTALNDAGSAAISYEGVDEVIQGLQAKVNEIAVRGHGKKDSHLVDLFSSKTNKRMLKDLAARNKSSVGIKTGLSRFDDVAGGLQKQKMVTLIGRSGVGKSWINLLFVASAVAQGAKVILYPLEMTLTETAYRLYTIFTQQNFGANKVLRNYDLTTGRVTTKKVSRFLDALQDKFQGQLFIADVGSLSDRYTVERIEAEVALYKPDMFWVDYLTLLKGSSNGGSEDWTTVRHLSNGIKNTAMRYNCIGGCSAQVNREAIKANTFLPRLEHISYGDSIGQDADQVISLNRKGAHIYYALVKNRGGPEIPKTRVKFDVDSGAIAEEPEEAPKPEE